MQLQVDVSSVKSTIFLELLNLFKKDNMINDYKVIDNERKSYDDEIFEDLLILGDTLQDAQNGIGHKTSKVVILENV